MTDLMEQRLSLIQTLLAKDHDNDYTQLIQDMTNHIFNHYGKQIRSRLLFYVANIVNSQQQDSENLVASAIELIHTATIVHDDVIDESDLRRGQTTPHFIWGNATSILLGDYYFTKAFEWLVKTNNLALMELIASTTKRITQGELLQLNLKNQLIDPSTYEKIIAAKTASLFSVAMKAPAILNGLDDSIINTLDNLGRHIGTVFQMQDDYLDYFGSNDHFKKPLGRDFLEGKTTYPLIIANDEVALRTTIQTLLANPNRTKEQFEQLKQQLLLANVHLRIQERLQAANENLLSLIQTLNKLIPEHEGKAIAIEQFTQFIQQLTQRQA